MKDDHEQELEDHLKYLLWSRQFFSNLIHRNLESQNAEEENKSKQKQNDSELLKKHRNNCKQVFDEQHGTMFSLKDILLERSRLNSSYSTKHGLILTHMYITQKAEDQDNREEKGNEQKDPRYIIDAGKHTETKRERGAS